jgi:hypothetical protein
LNRNTGQMIPKQHNENLKDAVMRCYPNPQQGDSKRQVHYIKTHAEDQHEQDEDSDIGESMFSRANTVSLGTPQAFDEYESDPDEFTSDSELDSDWDDDDEDDDNRDNTIDPNTSIINLYASSDAEDDSDEESEEESEDEEEAEDSDYNSGRAYLTQEGRTMTAERAAKSIRTSREESAGRVIGSDFRNKRADDARREGMPVVEGQKMKKAQAEARDNQRNQRREARESQQSQEVEKQKVQKQQRGYQPPQRDVSMPRSTPSASPSSAVIPRATSSNIPSSPASVRVDRPPVVSKPISMREAARSDPYKPIPVNARHSRKIPPSVHWNQDREKPAQATHNTASQVLVKPKRTNELTASSDKDKILNQVLSTPVTLEVRDVLGVSKELRQMLSSRMKDQNPTSTEEARVHLLSSKEYGSDSEAEYWNKYGRLSRTKQVGYVPLMEVTVKWQDKFVRAIIDTGSEMNIVSNDIVDEVRPLIPRQVGLDVKMVGANNTPTTLDTHYRNVPLYIGEVETFADLFVMNKSPFQLLLGRPWQVNNLVSIEEHHHGTTLIIRGEGKPGGPVYQIDLGTPNSFIPFAHAYMVKADDETSDESRFQELDASEKPRRDDLKPEVFMPAPKKRRKQSKKSVVISRAEGRVLRSATRLQQVKEYLDEQYVNNDPLFEVHEIADVDERELLVYLLATQGSLFGHPEYLPEKYKNIRPVGRRINMMNKAWITLRREWVDQYENADVHTDESPQAEEDEAGKGRTRCENTSNQAEYPSGGSSPARLISNVITPGYLSIKVSANTSEVNEEDARDEYEELDRKPESELCARSGQSRFETEESQPDECCEDPDLEPTNPQIDDSQDLNDNESLEASDSEDELQHGMQLGAHPQTPIELNPQTPTPNHYPQTTSRESTNVQKDVMGLEQKLDSVMTQLQEWLDSIEPPFDDPEEELVREQTQECCLDEETRQENCAPSSIEQDACEDDAILCEDSISNVDCLDSSTRTLTDGSLSHPCLQDQEEMSSTQENSDLHESPDDDDDQQSASEHDESNETTACEDEESDEDEDEVWYECEEEGGEMLSEFESRSHILNDISQTDIANEYSENVPRNSSEMRPHRALFHEMKRWDRPLISILLEIQRRQQNAKQKDVSNAIVHQMQTDDDYSPKNERVLTNNIPECPATKLDAMCSCDEIVREGERRPECEGEIDAEEKEAHEERAMEAETWPRKDDRTDGDQRRSDREKSPNDDEGNSEGSLDESGLQDLLSFIDRGNVITNHIDTGRARDHSLGLTSLSSVPPPTTRSFTLPWTSWTNVKPSYWDDIYYVSNPECEEENADSRIVPAMPGSFQQSPWYDEDREPEACDSASVWNGQPMSRAGEIELRPGERG